MITREEARGRIDAIAARFRGLLHQHQERPAFNPAPLPELDPRPSAALRVLADAVIAVADDLGPNALTIPSVDQAQTDLYHLAAAMERLAEKMIR